MARPLNGPPIWFTYHVPKTGGQTLRDHLRAVLGPTEHVHVGAWAPGDAPVDHEVLDAHDPDRIRVLTGHGVTWHLRERFPGRTVNEVLILREPASRLVSQLHYRNWRRSLGGRRPLSFDELAAAVGPDPMTRWAAQLLGGFRPRNRLDGVLHSLRRLAAVVDLSDLDVVLPALLRAMGLDPTIPTRRNRAGVDIPRGTEPTDEQLEEWRRQNIGDVILHHEVLGSTARTLQRLEEIADAAS